MKVLKLSDTIEVYVPYETVLNETVLNETVLVNNHEWYEFVVEDCSTLLNSDNFVRPVFMGRVPGPFFRQQF